MNITKIAVKKTKKEVILYIGDKEWAKIHRFGATFYTEVSDNIPKSAIRAIAKIINNSDYFNSELKSPKLYEIRAIEKQLEKYLNKNIPTAQEI